MPQGQHLGQQRVSAPVGGGIAQLDQGMQATPHRRPRNLCAVADLGDGQVTLALLECLHHCKAAGQRGHEIGVTGKGLDAFGRRGDDGRRQGRKRATHVIVQPWPFGRCFFCHG
ncbi:hypothetical protein D9M71_516050 [compost metagenome]